MSRTTKLPKLPWDKLKISRSTYFRRQRRNRLAEAKAIREQEIDRRSLRSVVGLSEPSKVGRMAMLLTVEDNQPPLNDYERGRRDASLVAVKTAVQRALVDQFVHDVTYSDTERRIWQISENQVYAIYEALRKAGYGNHHGRDTDLADAAVLDTGRGGVVTADSGG